MEISREKFEDIKKQAKEIYKSVGQVYCPYLKANVNFNNEGFEHLLFMSWNRGRSIKDKYIRLRLLPKAAEIIKKSYTLQEYNEKNMFVRQNINSRWEKRMKIVRYYGFVALFIDKGIRFKIICKQIEGGDPFFWSIYPSWKKKKDSFGEIRKVFYTGNLEID